MPWSTQSSRPEGSEIDGDLQVESRAWASIQPAFPRPRNRGLFSPAPASLCSVSCKCWVPGKVGGARGRKITQTLLTMTGWRKIASGSCNHILGVRTGMSVIKLNQKNRFNLSATSHTS